MEIQKLTYLEVQERIKKTPMAILPMGAVEAHGPHLPVGTDNYLAEGMAKKVAEKLDALLLPTFSYGQVWSLRNVPPSINVSNTHLIGVLTDIGKSLYKAGICYFVIINCHVGNMVAIKEAARKLYDEHRDMKVFYFIPRNCRDYRRFENLNLCQRILSCLRNRDHTCYIWRRNMFKWIKL